MNCPLCREPRSCQTVSSTYCLSVLHSGPIHDFIKTQPGRYHGTCLLGRFPELLDQLAHREGPEITRFRNILLDTEPRFDYNDLRLSASDSELLPSSAQLRELSLSSSPLNSGILTDGSTKSANGSPRTESPRSIMSPLARRNSIVTYRTTDARLINFSVALAYQVLKIAKERDLVEALGHEAQLAVTVCDLIGVETLPNLIENRVLRQILSEYVEQDPRAVVGLKTIMDHCAEHPQNLTGVTGQ